MAQSIVCGLGQWFSLETPLPWHATLYTHTRFPGVKFNAVWKDQIVDHVKVLKLQHNTQRVIDRDSLCLGYYADALINPFDDDLL